MISKNKTLMFSGAGFVAQIILVLFAYSNLFELCYAELSCRESFLYWVTVSSPYIHLFVPLFVYALVTYWMREEVYVAWFKFVRWWVPSSMFLILISPEYGGGLFNPIEKGSVAFATSVIFCVVSLLIIGVKLLRKPRG